MPTYTARWVLPVAGPPLEGGLVTVAGDRLAAVEPRGVRTADVDLGNTAIIPGLVNAHTHLDLSGARGRTPPTDAAHFTDWLRSVIAFRRSRTPEQVQADVRAGLAECLAAGTTLLGDITAGGGSYHAVAAADVRAVLFWELIGLTRQRYDAAELDMYRRTIAAEGADLRPVRGRLHWGVSPHAPYSANHLKASLALWGRTAAMHLAESPAEMELLATRSGGFVPFLQDLGVWEPDEIVNRPHEFLQPAAGLDDLERTGLFVHCNYLSADAPVHKSSTIVYCPRTHAAFGHPPHPFRDFLARGVRVCLGTDGLASNPDLDILAEARFVRELYSDFPGDQLLRMVTLSGAEALGWADECGSLEVGKSADLVAVPLPGRDGDPYELLFGEDCGPRRTMFRGEWRG